ncbi:MAG: hypothetical protein H7269_12530, partial [Cellulomonas sp.]|nr:hypothetical protein [Cellulomonas sp.]
SVKDQAVLEIALDDALRAEGYARDVVRAAQDARKAAGLQVTDRIRLTLGVPTPWRTAVEEHRDLIARETLATDVVVVDAAGGELTATVNRADLPADATTGAAK